MSESGPPRPGIMTKMPRSRLFIIAVSGAFALALNSIIILAEWSAVTPGGTGLLLFSYVGVGLGFPLIASVLAVPATTPVILFSARYRRTAVTILVAAIAYFSGFQVCAWTGTTIRMRAFERLAERSVPLVETLHAYEVDHSAPPPALDALVPDYLAEIPGTGMGAYPDYEYCVGHACRERYGREWALVVPAGRGFVNFDEFRYFPDRVYPERTDAGVYQRIRDWAYLHE
ncbi:MAG: hypothetical protein GY851_22410 [bacterium]|nr:hypothetical protein [bacterium]